MTYTELCERLQNTMENSFTVDQLALWAQQVEQKVYNAVQIPALRKNMTGTVTLSSPYLSLPSDFLYPYSLAVIAVDGSYTFLLNKDVNYIRQVYPSPASTGTPKVYGMFDQDTLILGPTPDAAYSVELHYGYYPESIVTAETTWLSDNYDAVLFNGMLIEAGRFLRSGKEFMELNIKLFDEAMAGLKQLGDGKLRQDAYRSGQVRTAIR